MSMQINESEESNSLASAPPGSESGIERSPSARRLALDRTPSSQQLLSTIVSIKSHSFLDLPNHNGGEGTSGIITPINIERNSDR